MSKYKINQTISIIYHGTIWKIHNHTINIIRNHKNAPDYQ